MKNIIDTEKEWEFIITETHKKFKKKNLLKREVLFALQILLGRLDFKNYFVLRKIYCKN